MQTNKNRAFRYLTVSFRVGFNSSLLYLAIWIWPTFGCISKWSHFKLWPVDVTWSAIAEAWHDIKMFRFYEYFAECEVGVKWASANSLAWSFAQSVGRSLLPSFGRKHFFVFPLTNVQLDFTKRKMSSNGSANVKHSEMSWALYEIHSAQEKK